MTAADRSLAFWHQMIGEHDLGQLPTIVHPEAVFHSPVSVLPYAPREPLVLAVTTMLDVLEDFSYQRQFPDRRRARRRPRVRSSRQRPHAERHPPHPLHSFWEAQPVNVPG